MRRNFAFLVIGSALGFVIGVLVGLLFAPQSGAQMRRRLADEASRAAEVARELADRAEQVADTLGERMDKALGRDEEIAWRRVREIRESMQQYTEAHGG